MIRSYLVSLFIAGAVTGGACNTCPKIVLPLVTDYVVTDSAIAGIVGGVVRIRREHAHWTMSIDYTDPDTGETEPLVYETTIYTFGGDAL